MHNTFDTPGKVRDNDLFEEMPKPSRRWARKRLGHFDIDPRNIFVGGFDLDASDGEHAIIPRLKLGDFGCASSAKLHKSNQFVLERRRWAKNGWFAPEQFGADWDHIAPTRKYGYELSEQPIAGNYEAINVWGIALSMRQLMTQAEVPLPPQPQPGEPLHYCPLLTTHEHFDPIDIELRETVERCLRHDPRLRPDLNTLLEQAIRGSQKMFENGIDDNIIRWMNCIISDAPDF